MLEQILAAPLGQLALRGGQFFLHVDFNTQARGLVTTVSSFKLPGGAHALIGAR